MAATFNATPAPIVAGGRTTTQVAAATAGGVTTGGGVDAAASVLAHVADADPHPQYETAAEVAAQVEAHRVSMDPHGDRAYSAGVLAAHVAEPDPHSQYAKKAGDTFTGSVGIGGAPTPGVALEVFGELRTNPSSGPSVHRFMSEGVERGKIIVDAASGMIVETAGVERLRVSPTGVVYYKADNVATSLEVGFRDAPVVIYDQYNPQNTPWLSLRGKILFVDTEDLYLPAAGVMPEGAEFRVYANGAFVYIHPGAGTTQRLDGTWISGMLTLEAYGFATITYMPWNTVIVGGNHVG